MKLYSKYVYRFSLKRISHISNLYVNKWDGMVNLPIINNSGDAVALSQALGVALLRNETSCSILVKQHGIFTFGKSWDLAIKELVFLFFNSLMIVRELDRAESFEMMLQQRVANFSIIPA